MQSGAAAFAGRLFVNKIAAKEPTDVARKARRSVEGQRIGADEDLPPENADECAAVRINPTRAKKRWSIMTVDMQLLIY